MKAAGVVCQLASRRCKWSLYLSFACLGCWGSRPAGRVKLVDAECGGERRRCRTRSVVVAGHWNGASDRWMVVVRRYFAHRWLAAGGLAQLAVEEGEGPH